MLFVGRITRQKGIDTSCDAARALRSRRPARALRRRARHAGDRRGDARPGRQLQAERGGVLWIEQILPRPQLIQVLTHAAVFVCPSVYEPFGLVNVEAMACGTAVVASAVGGIPEIVVDGETGILVPFEPDGGDERRGIRRRFARTRRAHQRARGGARRAGVRRGRSARVLEHFSWSAIADRTAELYRSLRA